MVQRNVRFILSLAAVAVVAACGLGTIEDPTLRLTGTESEPYALTQEDGGVTLACPANKALVCHVPPGNPANEHTICVGKPAVKAHLSHHPDYEGACGAQDAGTDGDGDVDAGQPAECVGEGNYCHEGDCCSGLSCIESVCMIPPVN